MRPPILNPLFADITTLKGVGPKLATLIAKVAGPRLIDLVLTLPTGIIDRSYRPTIGDAEDDRLATMLVHIDSHEPPPPGKSTIPWKVLCSDETGFLTLIFFRPQADFLRRQLPIGEKRLISGRIEHYRGLPQMAHPDYILKADEADSLPDIEPLYPLTAGLTAKVMRRAVTGALAARPALPEWQDPDILQREKWPGWAAALDEIHAPISRLALLGDSMARRRLAYDELLANQLALSLIRAQRRASPGRALHGTGALTGPARADLPYQLTGGQEDALRDIVADMAAPSQMVRLVQGDVGSGKTMVALFAMLTAIEAGTQAALMAPTEILARQHYDTLEPICERLNISLVLVTGRDKGQERIAKRDGIRKGYVPLVVGTHALFSDDVAFADLGLVVVDEQHRFGVAQRLKLQEKGRRADLLVMTATPIPRTLSLTAYGDMDVSLIKEKPPGRKPVVTRAVPAQKLDSVITAIGRAVSRGEQVYWVCPLVAPSEAMDMMSAEDRAARLREKFGDAVGLVHGKLKPAEKEAVVEGFYHGAISILVATTVIEVGVNAPNATVIVIEHAERFGLAQLHQLRGRVGRGDRDASCLLVYYAGDGGLSETAKARLSILRETEDGFRLAEEDLRLRGPGDALGTAQSGLPTFRLANLAEQGSLLEMARDEARYIVDRDPMLKTERGEALRVLLYLFGQDEAVKRLRSG